MRFSLDGGKGGGGGGRGKWSSGWKFPVSLIVVPTASFVDPVSLHVFFCRTSDLHTKGELLLRGLKRDKNIINKMNKQT